MPLAPAELAAEARAAADRGAQALHLHPRDAAGAQTLDPDQVLAAVAATLAQASMLDELTHAEQVVKRDLRAVFGGARAVASGKSQVAVALEPPALREFEPGHLVADPE